MRLQLVERRCYSILGMVEVMDAMSNFAHLTDRNDLGFLIGFMAKQLRQDADEVLQAAATFPPRGPRS
ncbi:hypothetical protein ABMY26_06255 (plasmid) [Azospirillum sp. HJ39]|uniref:hypothetical protein n=1 Tax=Azospirillum sp. HJ39 TaxID=3159496 RepID=UPI0035576744